MAPGVPSHETPGCARCGSKNLGKGYILTNSPNFRPAAFAPRRLTPRRARWAVRLWQNTLEVEAIVCRDCGHLMLGVDPGKLKQIEQKYPATD
ncbi:MAG: hypothetical protein JXB47_14070 [Anaerolineae bacterium]|nr:hypothetical protein [Anaerolineae bacterium]